MTPSSRAKHSSESPITKIPYDVLREIFIHCLPHHPLQIQQPNTTVAPMLLCQICSCWRTVALATPSLWLHLSYRIHASYFDRELGINTFRRKDLDFMMWWKRRQGGMAPLSYLDLKIGASRHDSQLPKLKGDMDVILKYVTSARYLRVNSLFWQYIHDEFGFGVGEDVIFPDPHTLMTDRQDPYFHHAQIIIGRTHTSSVLRRLFINGSSGPMNPITPNHWSKLTHLAMLEVTFAASAWFSLIRSLPDLEWASISFGFYDEYDTEGKSPTKHILPRLSTLFLTCCEHSSDDVALPFALIFTNLYLPALRTLSLSSMAESWENDHTITELYTVLDSTPSVTTLALRGCDDGFLSLHKHDYADILSARGDMDPLWRHAPHLTHLQLDLPSVSGGSDADARNALDTFVCNFFWPAGWLALNDLACPIRRVTFIADNAWSPRFRTVRDLTASSILSRAGEISDIVFEIVSEATVNDAGSQAWRAWGSRNE